MVSEQQCLPYWLNASYNVQIAGWNWQDRTAEPLAYCWHSNEIFLFLSAKRRKLPAVPVPRSWEQKTRAQKGKIKKKRKRNKRQRNRNHRKHERKECDSKRRQKKFEKEMRMGRKEGSKRGTEKRQTAAIQCHLLAWNENSLSISNGNPHLSPSRYISLQNTLHMRWLFEREFLWLPYLILLAVHVLLTHPFHKYFFCLTLVLLMVYCRPILPLIQPSRYPFLWYLRQNKTSQEF